MATPSSPSSTDVAEILRAITARVTDERKQFVNRQVTVLLANDPATAALAHELSANLSGGMGVNVRIAPAESRGPTSAGTATTLPSPVEPHIGGGLEEYCLEFLGRRVWEELRGWYANLRGAPALDLLRINVDSECRRDDLDPDVWQAFLRALAAAGPDPVHPFAAVSAVIDSDRPRFLLRGRRLDYRGRLCRYTRLDHFVKY